MQYMGGKGRIARHVERVVLEHREGRPNYLEPFLGGAFTFSRIAPHFERAVASDLMPDLVELWKAARDGWLPPEFITREDYAALRRAESSALRAFVGFGCSFGGKWFGGYASNARGDDFCGAARRGVLKKAEGLRGTRIECCSYDHWEPGANAVVYCDPPYAGTTAYAGADAWDAPKFWEVVERWARNGAVVLVSEYAAPAGWEAVWSAEVKQSLKKDTNVATATEHIFRYAG